MAQVATGVCLDDIKAIVRQIVSRFHPQKVILFGSYAYGEPTPHSDVDLLVIMETDENPLRTAGRVSAAIPHPFPIDILVETPRYFAEALAENDLFETKVVREGIVLYEAPNH
ncbi:MAG: nucleotidyltransferase domain-containing protein [Planctomycetes bacterium]|nr:nucleotidyltransferase domain-containing protein [Planctomycetota bacterium]